MSFQYSTSGAAYTNVLNDAYRKNVESRRGLVHPKLTSTKHAVSMRRPIKSAVLDTEMAEMAEPVPHLRTNRLLYRFDFAGLVMLWSPGLHFAILHHGTEHCQGSRGPYTTGRV